MSFEDDMRFEEELRRAFKVEDPGEAFTRRVLERVQKEGAARPASAHAPESSSDRKARTSTSTSTITGASTSTSSGSGSGANWRMTLAFAASLAIAVSGVAWVRHTRYVEEGERARAQVMTALRVTSEKLSVVRSVVNETQEAR